MSEYIWNQQYRKSFFYQLKSGEMICRAVVSEEYGFPTIKIELEKGWHAEQVRMMAAELIRYLDGNLPLHRLKYRGYPVSIAEE